MESCQTCKAPICISHLSLFHNLSPMQSGKIVKHVTRRGFNKGDIFLNQGDVIAQFVIVSRGQFKAVSVNEEGKAKVIHYLKTGDFFGQDSLFEKKEMTYSIEAMSDGALCMIDSATMQELIHNEPDLALSILNELNHRVSQLESELSTIHAESLEVRLMNLLTQLSHDYGVKDDHGIRLNCPLSQDEMAMRLGVSRESVNRKLKQLEKNERIKIQSRREIIIY
jgi:CRP/FNR family transcriptional regulator, anaerobic regulatory protein